MSLLRLISSLAAAPLLALFLAAQQPPPPAPNTVQVTADGQVQAFPDTALVHLDVTGQGPNLKAAYALAQSQAGQLRSLLRQQGFAPEQAHWSSYAVQPGWDFKAHKVTDYTVSTALTLEVADFTKIGLLLDAFGSAGLASLRAVDFEVKDPAAAKSAAIADAYRQSRLEAEALARAADRQLLSLAYAAVDTSGASPFPAIHLLAQSAGASVPAPTESFSPHPITFTAHLTAVYRLNP